MRRRRGDSDLERLFDAAGPHAPAELVERLTALAAPPRRGGRSLSRLALSVAVSVALLAGLGAVGGISYAASLARTIVRATLSHTVDFGTRMAVSVQQNSAATDQYGNPTQSGNTKSDQAKPETPGSVDVEAPPPAGSTEPVQVAVTWTPTTFSQPVVVHVDPTPPQTSSTTLLGTKNQVISVVVDDASGHPIHALPTPLDVVFKNPPANFVPVVSEDGKTFRALKQVSGPGSDLGSTGDGYYVDAATHDIHILTLHLTIFAVLYKANVNVSESGRKLAPVGSGKWGDPSLIHPGPAKLRRVGPVSVYPLNGLSGRAVGFSFFVDEQVAAYVSLFHGDTAVPIALRGTMIRGTTISRPGTQTTLHIPVLRPGTLYLRLRIPGTTLVPGERYRLRIAALDFDGNKTVEYIPVTG